jgi:hypothetical protein
MHHAVSEGTGIAGSIREPGREVRRGGPEAAEPPDRERRMLEVADRAISEELSKDSEEFLARNRQSPGE